MGGGGGGGRRRSSARQLAVHRAEGWSWDRPTTHPLCSTSRILCSHMGLRHITWETLRYIVPHVTVPQAPQLRA